ncbi:MAG: hypothetical protein LJE96_02835 [Deltaproteobacteria bacterium]|nr:hypothetical protein [Deltaproteobacteria bacterium]
MKVKIIVIILSFIIFFIIVALGCPNFTSNVLSGRIHFPEENIGSLLKLDNGQTFTVFRRLKVEENARSNNRQAVFFVRFKFDRFDIKTNKVLSMIPAIFLIGMNGFREKYWAADENTNSFLGIYEWATEDLAKNYQNSFIFGMLTKRSASNTLFYRIMPDTSLSQFVERLSVHQNGKI